MDKVLFVFLLCFYFCCAKIKINKLDVPSAILYGSQNDAILDCDFDSGGDDVTEIKWFLDGDNQIYQWLPSMHRKAQAIGKLKDHIDVNYKATDDEKTMYRALRITDLSPEFSGNYTCKVSSLNSEDVETKRMIIYATPDEDSSDDDYDDEILDIIVNEEASEITCSSGSYYPEPNMTLYIIVENDNDTEIVQQQDAEEVFLTDEGFFNVSATLKYDSSNLTQTFTYICDLNLPGTPYNISESGVHIQEDVEEDVYEIVEEVFYNSTNTTESAFEDSKELETQIEEEFDLTPTTTETATNIADDVTEEPEHIQESSSLQHLPNVVVILVTSLFWVLIHT